MKSNLKSYRLCCQACGQIHLVTDALMQSSTWIVLWCRRCQAHTDQKKVD